MRASLADLVKSNFSYVVMLGLLLVFVISYLVTGSSATFYLVLIGVLFADDVTERILLKVLRQRFSSAFKEGVFWRTGFATNFGRFFLSLAIMGLLGFKEQFGLTLRNVNESMVLILLVGLPFVALFSGGAFIFMRKSKSGRTAGYTPDIGWMKTSTDRIGTVAYTFTMNGLSEELLYRGLIQGYLSMNMAGFVLVGSFPMRYSTILASLIFILVHFFSMGETKEQSIFMLPYRVIITFIVAVAFQLTGSLLAPIIIHSFSNGFLALAAIQATKE